MITKKTVRTISRILIIVLLAGTVQLSGIQLSVEREARVAKAMSSLDFENIDEKLLELEQFMTVDQTDFFEPSFYDVNKQWRKEQIAEGTQVISFKGSNTTGVSNETSVKVAEYEGRDGALVWTPGQTEWIEYEVEVEREGLYEMALDYHPFISEESRSYKPTVLAVSINDVYQYREARAVEFPRLFKDTVPLLQDEYGDDIRPRPIELHQWIERPFYDADRAYSYPLKWYLAKGQNTIRLQTYEPIVIDQITLRPQKEIDPYEVVSSQYPQGSAHAELQVIETEYVESKNQVSLQMLSDKDAFMSPRADGKRIFNGIGGREWRNGGGMAAWTFEVPETGLYKIAMRTFQGYDSNKSIFRNIYIDGVIPFAEMLAYRFPYSKKWEGTHLTDEKGEPFEFYLEAGTHTISMEATYSPYNAILKNQEKISIILRDLSQDLNAMTGGNDDLNRSWNIVRDFPEIPERLKLTKEILDVMADELINVNGRLDNNSQSLISAAKDIEDMLKHPNDIPYKLENISITQNRIGSIRLNLVSAPLALDRIYIAPSDERFPRLTANMIERLSNGLKSFFLSFSDERMLSYNDEDVLNVWVFMGRDYVNLLQEMANQYFTPTTGIKVKVDLVPREELIVLANATGKAPDVAIGMSEGKPIEFAFRGAAEELSKYPGFEETFAQFAPGAMLPYYYDEGWYALPETQSFRVLFYRKDILDRLGLSVPETWDDVIAMLPTLQQNHYNFFLPNQEYLTFIYQYGADFYEKDGMRTALNTPEAVRSFKTITDFFTIYGIDQHVPSFYQHFRDGFMPIGISDFNTYLQLTVAAPELHGWWDMAPLPGVRNDEGVVERWSGGNLGMLSQGLGGFGGSTMDSGSGGQSAAMMFERSEKKDWGWEFIQWWVSAETQERFGMDLEGFYGVQFRWNTANVEAFSELPWTQHELNILLEQWRWYKALSVIPGSYFIPRELMNAWNRTVLEGMNYRSSLEEAVVNINRELYRKSIEFNYRDELGNILKTYDPPQVNTPWEGVDRYVRY